MAEETVFTDGREAERLLNDPAFAKAMQRMENDTVRDWKAATTKEKREELHATIRAIRGVRDALDAMKGDKAMAEAKERTFGKQRKGS